MSEQPWMPLYVADYMRDTDNLNMEESGAYLHLLMAMWARDGTIPDDDKDNARRLRFRIDRWLKIKARLMPFLTVENGFLTQKRLRNEHLAAQIRVKKARDNGAKGGRPSAKINDLAEPEGSIPVNRNESIARASSQPQSQEDTPLRGGRAPKGTRLPVDWILQLDDEAWALAQGLSRERVQATAIKFKNYWLAKSGKDATKIDWSRTWQNWVLSDLERKPNGTGPPQKPRTGAAKLGDLLSKPLGETYANYSAKFDDARGGTETPPRPAVRAIRDR